MAFTQQPINGKTCLEYAAARVAAFLFWILPLPLAAGLGQCIGWLFYTFDKRHRERVTEQIHLAFGAEMTEERATALTRDMYRHFGWMLAEFVRVPLLQPGTVHQYVEWDPDWQYFEESLAAGKGVIYVTGHIGNWEVGGAATAARGVVAGSIARPLDNPLIDDYVRVVRESTGNCVWDKFGAMRNAMRALKNNQAFGILADQDAGKRGVFVPFFGEPASTIPTPADLAIKTGAPLLVACMHRTDRPMHFRLRAHPPLYADPEADPESERLRLLTEINRRLEELIRAEPAQWLWLHRRWKTRPRDEG